MARCRRNLRALRRRRLKADGRVAARVAKLKGSALAAANENLKLRNQLDSLSCAVEMILKDRLLVKVQEVFAGCESVRVRYRHPPVPVPIMLSPPAAGESYAALARKIVEKSLASRVYLSPGFAEDFWREMSTEMYGEVVLKSLRALGEQIAAAIFSGVVVNACKLADKIREVSNA